jgi:addiction module HigA family antidote
MKKFRTLIPIKIMSLDFANFDHNAPPPHPGEVLREDMLPSTRLSAADLARHIGVSHRVLADVLDERQPVTLDLARRLGAAFGCGAHYWLGLQIQYDLYQARVAEPVVVKPLLMARTRSAGAAASAARS